MRRLALMVAAAAMAAGSAVAQDAVIRVEAKRGAAQASQAAAGWRAKFDDVVTFPLSGDWVAIALGPQPRDAAEARLAQLKAAGQVPGDSFVAATADGVSLSPVGPVDGTATAAGEADQPGTGATDNPSPDTPAPETAVTDEVTIQADQPRQPEAGSYIRLQSVRNHAEAQAALAEWRKAFPEAGLMALPGGWETVTLGPMEAETARAWLAAFKASGDLPKDAFASEAGEMDEVIEAGSAPDLPQAAAPQEMPPLEAVQRALRWAGHYDGAIDGESGPRTREAIAREVATQRSSPDAGTAMRKLIERRAAWRAEMGLTNLTDEATGLSLTAPMDKLVFDRAERALSIYGPKDGSGAALILFSQPGGQQELLDLGGLVTALGWVPHPQRMIERGHILLEGEDGPHLGRAEGWVRDGRAEGFVLIWPAEDKLNQRRIAAEMSDSLHRVAPAGNDGQDPAPATPVTP